MRARRILSAVVVAAAVVGGAAGAGADAPTETGWWSRLNPGLPIGPPVPTVPEGGLFVANDPTGPSAVSALRFSAADGTPGTLRLRFASTPVGTPKIVACRVTGAWQPAVNGPMSQAPSYDCADAVAGSVGADGVTVTWELPGSFATLGAVDVALVPAPDAGSFQAPFSKPSPDAFTSAGTTGGDETGGGAVPESAPVEEPAPADFGAPVEFPGGTTFDLPPPPAPAPPPTSAAVGTPAARGGEVALFPAAPVGAPAPGGRGDQILGFSLLAVVGAALWLLGDRPARAPRLIGGAASAPPVAGPAAARSGSAAGATGAGRARARLRRAGSGRPVRIGGIGRFARPREGLPHRL
jgi:hypothetical protein